MAKILTYPPSHHANLKLISQERKLHFYQKGEDIPLLSQGIWQVNQGVVQLETLNNMGKEVLIGWVKPANCFGLWLTSLDICRAKALSNVYLQWYSVSEIESSPSISHKILNQVVSRIRQTEYLLAIAGIQRVEERLIALLNLLGRELGENIENGIRIGVRFTHQSLANVINTTRVTVTRLLGDFQRRGLIDLDENRLIIIRHLQK